MSKMISFIVIGRNEAKTLQACFISIIKTIKVNSLKSHEIIYVDSKSSDESLEFAIQFPEVKIFEITGECNAAIARNIGANEAKGSIFVFLDADMVLQPEFLSKVFENDQLIYPFISGQLKNIFYNSEWKKIGENYLFPKLKEDDFFSTTGGYFIIKRSLWFAVNGMDTKYRRSQDIDLGLRLAKHGTLLLRKKELFVEHHTVSYTDKKRIWKMMFNGDLFFNTSVIIRDHLFNYHFLRKNLRNNYSLLILIICLSLSYIDWFFLLLYPGVIIAKSLFRNRKGNIIREIAYFFLIDIISLLFLFTFFPSKKEQEYISR